MDQVRLMQILKVTLAYVMDVSEGAEIDKDHALRMYNELHHAIRKEKTKNSRG